MALQPLYLGIAVSTYRILRCVEDRLADSGRRLGIALMQGGVIVGVLWMGALWVRATRDIVRDVRENVAFGLSDIPLEEKLEALEALDRAARGRPTATVAYRNASFGPTFPFVAIYGVQEGAPPRDYRAGSFFEAVLNARSRTRYTFVDGGSVADYSLTHPSGSTWAQDGHCRRIWRGRRLALWQCSAIAPPPGPAGLPAGRSGTAAPGGG
jgi:hypothetical protein